jgi:transcriptional regulator GlxA family with amidase domain
LHASESIAFRIPEDHQRPDPRDDRPGQRHGPPAGDLVTASPGEPTTPLARRAGASLRTLERCFLSETGLSLGEWRRRVRLFHALHLLQGGASVTEVALDVGYASVSAFSQAFARQFGHSPSKLRR